MRSRTLALWGISVAALALAGPAGWAHSYVDDDGTHVNADTAISIMDVSVSQVAYHTVEPFSPTVWFTFLGEANQSLHVELGVPKIDRLKDFRPAYAVLGPGLPSVSVPFQVPDGYGGWVFTYDDAANPEVFHEEFTGTDSWKFPTSDLTLPERGQYYVVGFAPNATEGKLWLAVGTKESFTTRDILTLPGVLFKVRQFHEVGPVGGILGWGLLLFSTLLLLLLILIPLALL